MPNCWCCCVCHRHSATSPSRCNVWALVRGPGRCSGGLPNAVSHPLLRKWTLPRLRRIADPAQLPALHDSVVLAFSLHKVFLFLKWRWAHVQQFHSLSQNQSTVPQQSEELWPSVPWRVVCELVSLIGYHTLPGQHSQPTPTLLGQGCIQLCLPVSSHLHFVRKYQSFTCHCSRTGWADTR